MQYFDVWFMPPARPPIHVRALSRLHVTADTLVTRRCAAVLVAGVFRGGEV